MGFKKVNCKAEIDAELKKNPEMIKLAEEFDREYELIKKIVKVRKEMGPQKSRGGGILEYDLLPVSNLVE